jgi:hypothetical protein
MTLDDFIANGQGVTLTEHASAQERFIDLCGCSASRSMPGSTGPADLGAPWREHAHDKKKPLLEHLLR